MPEPPLPGLASDPTRLELICRCRLDRSQARFYYAVTLLSRTGILVGIIMRLSGADTLALFIVHTTSVMTSVVSLAAFGHTDKKDQKRATQLANLDRAAGRKGSVGGRSSSAEGEPAHV